MKEIGGYIEFEHYRRPRLHEGAVPLNSGRNALAYLCRLRHIRKIRIPYFLCDSVPELLKREGIAFDFYSIDSNFLPQSDLKISDGEVLYLVNYYGLLDNAVIERFVARHIPLIVDNAQDFFREPLPGVDTLYTCRKFFGVADGAFLYTDAAQRGVLERDCSFEHMHFLLGRFEKSASEFYSEYVRNNKRFSEEPVKAMSLLTYNLLRGIDYEDVRNRRNTNWAYLNAHLGSFNELKLQEKSKSAPFAYPLLVKDGVGLKRALIERKIYIPTLWPNVLDTCPRQSIEYRFAANILPLSVDQRYTAEDMEEMSRVVISLMQ